MKRFVLRSLFAALALCVAGPAFAGDPGAPSVEGLRRAIYDWSGPYAGTFVGGSAVDGSYDATAICACAGAGSKMSGFGFHGGGLAGMNRQFGRIVVGVEGDLALGSEQASNDAPALDSHLTYGVITTLRARAGFAHDRTLFYVTGGATAIDSEFGGLVGPSAITDSDSKWIFGWAAGAGVEQAFTGALRARLEYLYVGLPDTTYTLSDGLGVTASATQTNKSMQMLRLALTYKFNW